MLTSFEPLLLQIKSSSYQSSNNLPINAQVSNPSSPNRPPKNQLFQTVQSFPYKRSRQQSVPNRSFNRKSIVPKINTTLGKKDSSMSFHTTSFLKLFVKNSQESSQQESMKNISNKLQAFKAPINTVITLEDLAIKRSFKNKGKNSPSNGAYINPNQSLDSKLAAQLPISNKDAKIRLNGDRSFQEYSPTESPISDDNTVSKKVGRSKTADRTRWLDDGNNKINDSFEVSREIKPLDLSLTQDEKIFKKVNKYGGKQGKDWSNLSLEMSNSFSSKKGSASYGVAFGRRGRPVDLPKDKGQNKNRLETLDSCEETITKMSTKGRGLKKRYDVYHQIATEEERERMYKFLKDEYVNEMLMNRFQVDLDKFQIRDAISVINKKVNQDKLLRKKFQDFLKNGIIKAPLPMPEERPHDTLKKTSFQNHGIVRRKNSEMYVPQVSEDPINVVDGSQDEIKGKRKMREAVLNMLKEKAKSRLTMGPIDLRKTSNSPQEGRRRSARSDEGNEDPMVALESKEDERQRELHRIRLTETKNKLNSRFSRSMASDTEEITPKGPMLGTFLEQEGLHMFIKAARDGDLMTIKKCLDLNPTLISSRDLMKQTALHWAAKEGHLQVCQALLDAGARINPLDMADKTPLYYALKEKKPAVVKFLLSCETGPLAEKMTTFETLGEGVELVEVLKEAQPLPVQPVKKAVPRRMTKYSVRIAPPRRESDVAIKLVGMNKAQESII